MSNYAGKLDLPRDDDFIKMESIWAMGTWGRLFYVKILIIFGRTDYFKS